MNERLTITRAFASELELDGDGRTLFGRCVPYNVPASVADPPPADPTPYVEVWARGAFAGLAKDPARVALNFMHQTSLREHLGRAIQFTETDDGLDGVFRILDHADGDKALAMVRDGTHRGLSIHAAVVRSRRRDDGVIERRAARLLHVALVDRPAYELAQVSAIRSGDEPPTPSLDEIRAEQERRRVKYATHD